MKALTYHGSHDVRVEEVPDPTLVQNDDIILRVTATAICGSDLHLYRGKMPALKDGDILGHEFMGVVEEVGSGVTEVAVSDRVVIPFVIACGKCFHCLLDEYSACETTNTGKGAALNQKGIKPRRPSSAIRTSTGVCQAAKRNSFASPTPTSARSVFPMLFQTSKSCSFPTSCQRATKPCSTPASGRAPPWPSSAPDPWA